MILPSISLSTPPLIQPEGKTRKLLKRLSGNDYLMEVDNSSLQSFTMCPREAEYKLVNGRSGAGGYALTYGKAVHAALEFYYKEKQTGREPVTEDCLQKGFAILSANSPPPNEWRSADVFHNMFLKYVKRYVQEDSFEIVGVEQPFAMPLAVFPINTELPYDTTTLIANHQGDNKDSFYVENIHVSWTGVIDLILRESGLLWILDHKTASRNDSGLWSNFELSPQFLGYVWAAERITGERVVGTKANVIISRKPTKTGSDLELVRQSFHYKLEHLVEWEFNTKEILSSFFHSLTSQSFPMYTNNCVRKYGTCQFHDVCKMVPANRMTMLYSGAYVNNTWNPLD